MYKRVVVPLDGSLTAEAILPFIIDIAGPLDLEVILVRTVQPVPPQVVEGSRHVEVEDVEARRLDAEEYLAPLVVELASRAVRVHQQVRRGDPTGEIIACARESGADLIAMTTHGRRGLDRLVFGSVAEGVLHHAHLPVLMMRMTEADLDRRRAQEAAERQRRKS